jgi:hypothetical protein
MPNPLMRSRSTVREDNGDEGSGYQPLATLDCIIERVTFHNQENGYSVVKVSDVNAKSRAAREDVITVLGAFTNPIVGESLRCFGEWIKHPQYGHQFKLERYETIRPATAAAIESILARAWSRESGRRWQSASSPSSATRRST